MRETSWGSEFGWAPVGHRRTQPHVWDSWLVAAAAWSNRSAGAEMRVVDGTHQGSMNRVVHSLSSLFVEPWWVPSATLISAPELRLLHTAAATSHESHTCGWDLQRPTGAHPNSDPQLVSLIGWRVQ